MRRIVSLWMALACVLPTVALALDDPDRLATPIEARHWGMGLGAATHIAGLTVKRNLPQSVSAQLFVGLFRGSGYGLGLDVVRQMGRLVDTPAGSLNWSAGLGVGVAQYASGFDKHFMDVPFSGIAELNWHFQRYQPFELVLSARPSVGRREGANEWIFYTVPAGAIRWFF